MLAHLVRVLTVFAVPLALAPLAAAQQSIDIQRVEILVGKQRVNGALVVDPYELEITVEGTNLTSVSVTDPQLVTHALLNTADGWFYVAPAASSLGSITTGFGSFLFTFTGPAGQQTVTLNYSLTSDPHSGYGRILCPTNGQTNVPLNATMSWTCAAGPCGNVAWYMEVYPLYGTGAEYGSSLYDPSATTWTPGLLSASTSYGFWLSAGTFVNPVQVLSTSDPLDSFNYVQGYETSNETVFVTDASAAPTVTTYCTSGSSASGCTARISACGIASATASSGFELIGTNVEDNKDGLFFYGANGQQANPWGNGTSYQCVTPPVKRGGLLASVSTGAASCDGFFKQDLNARWCPACPKWKHNPGAGAVVQAQLWYRDPLNTSNQTTSLSDAIEFPVGP